MLGRLASAPGKIILSGEYAVLDGAPAVAMAVNRRAVVSSGPTISPETASDTRLLESVCQALGIEASQAFTVQQDTAAFFEAADGQGPGRKLGIGSSAALAVALCKLLSEPSGSIDALFQVAQIAHRNFQGGVGSGVDVATSVMGGLIAYRRSAGRPQRLPWPPGLCFRVLWSGVPSSTRDKLARLNSGASRPSRDRLRLAAQEIAVSWASDDAAALLAKYTDYIEALGRFDVEHRLGVFSAGHRELTDMASRRGVTYKPCGAGGGDIGIAFGLDEPRLEAFVDFATAAGFRELNVQLDEQGVADA